MKILLEFFGLTTAVTGIAMVSVPASLIFAGLFVVVAVEVRG